MQSLGVDERECVRSSCTPIALVRMTSCVYPLGEHLRLTHESNERRRHVTFAKWLYLLGHVVEQVDRIYHLVWIAEYHSPRATIALIALVMPGCDSRRASPTDHSLPQE
jgi:hypothetical protein